MKYLSYKHICPVCGESRLKAGSLGAVSHPACSKKMQEMQAGKNERKKITTPRMKNKFVEYFAKTGQ
jgi:hypothetical protein